MRTRRLAIKRETLTALATDELALVAGAAAVPEHTIPDTYCVREFIDRYFAQSGGCV